MVSRHMEPVSSLDEAGTDGYRSQTELDWPVFCRYVAQSSMEAPDVLTLLGQPLEDGTYIKKVLRTISQGHEAHFQGLTSLEEII